MEMENAIPTSQVIEDIETLWGVPYRPAGCDHCRRVFLVDEAAIEMNCPACQRGRLTAQPALLRREPPELNIQFQIQRDRLLSILSSFAEGVWLRPDDFNPKALLERAVPLFWPMWLVDCTISGSWQAECGYEYQVKSSQESYIHGNWQTREYLETRLRWESRLGQIERPYHNIATPALEEHQTWLRQTGGYRLENAVAYQPGQLPPALVRVPDLPQETIWPTAQDSLHKAAAEDCRKAANAQAIRNFSPQADYRAQHWTQLLLPLYLTSYTDDAGQPQMIFVNGQTGAISGARLASQKKGWKWAGIIAAFAAVLFLLALLSAALTTLYPPLITVASILGFLALVVGGAALIPAIWPWQWNRRQQGQKVMSSKR